jgi:hypothetical protein
MNAVATSAPRFLAANGWQYHRYRLRSRSWLSQRPRRPWRDPVSHEWMNLRAALRTQRERD